MDAKEAIARFFCKAARAEIGEPVAVELLSGAGQGDRLLGGVGWSGSCWHVMIDKSVSDWQLWCNLWHEAAPGKFQHFRKHCQKCQNSCNDCTGLSQWGKSATGWTFSLDRGDGIGYN